MAAAPRQNPVGVQLLSEHMHAQLFPGEPLPKVPDNLLAISKDHLQMHGLSPEGAAVLPEISFDMPALEGGNIRQHFHALGNHAAEPYLSMAKDFSQLDLPPMPAQWVVDRPGWTRYAADGSTSSVDSLDGETIVSFDVETLWKVSPYAVMATAASKDAWYSWLSPSVFEDPPAAGTEAGRKPVWDKSTPETCPHTLIPLFKGSKTPAIAIGHNVGYDRQRVAEEYCLEGTQTRWLDTLSLHVATRGITSVQRAAWMKYRKNKVSKAEQCAETAEVLQEEADKNGDSLLAQSLAEWNGSADEAEAGAIKTWEEVTSANSLADVAALHCGIKVDKSIRDRFGDDDIKHASELRPELAELLTYCANDVLTTHKVYKEVLPLFLNSCPHPVSFSGMLTMGSAFLPVDEQWKEYLRNAETKYQELNEGVRQALRHLAENVRLAGPKEDDPWISQLDWTPKAARWADESAPVAESAPVTKAKPKASKKSSTVPRWYAALAEPSDLATNNSQRYLLPLLMRMSFRGYPVYYLHDHYWCFKAPLEAVADLCSVHGAPVELSPKDAALEPLLDDAVFFRIPLHSEARRTKLVGKGVKKDVANGLLTSPYADLLNRLTSAGPDTVVDQLMTCAKDMLKDGRETEWGTQLDWTIDSSSGGWPRHVTSNPLSSILELHGLYSSHTQTLTEACPAWHVAEVVLGSHRRADQQQGRPG